MKDNNYDINLIADVILNDGIVVMPTDTVYGIICDATNENAIDKIYQLKNRDYSKAMIILVSDLSMINNCCTSLNELEKELLLESPCPTTVIVKRNKTYLPDILVAGKDEIAIRKPHNHRLLELIKRINKPIVSTSANISNHETITDVELLENSIKNNINLLVDGGHINNCASTIVKVVEDKIKLIRKNDDSIELINKYKDRII